jgi:hypothetical protein
MGGTQWREHPKTTEKRLVYSLLRLWIRLFIECIGVSKLRY